MDLGESQTQVATSLGKSEAYVSYVRALIDAPAWLIEVQQRGQCKGLLELYQLRTLHARAPAEVERWADHRESITRSDLQHLKATLTNAPGEVDSTIPGSADDGLPSALARIEPTAAGLSAKKPSQSVEGTVVQGTAAAASSNAELKSSQERDSGPSPSCCRLFAKLNGELVELVVDQVPPDRDKVFVRAGLNDEAVACVASSLTLVGFRSTPRLKRIKAI